MRIHVNGREIEAECGLTVSVLVSGMGLDPAKVVVEYNLSVAPQEDWPELIPADGDRVEIISFVGGG